MTQHIPLFTKVYIIFHVESRPFDILSKSIPLLMKAYYAAISRMTKTEFSTIIKWAKRISQSPIDPVDIDDNI